VGAVTNVWGHLIFAGPLYRGFLQTAPVCLDGRHDDAILNRRGWFERSVNGRTSGASNDSYGGCEQGGGQKSTGFTQA